MRFAFFALLMAACGAAWPVDLSVSLWYDDFRDLGRSSFARHLLTRSAGGVTVSSAPQVWTLPGDSRFSSCAVSGTLEVKRGAAGEEVTLWQRILEPGTDLQFARGCAPAGTDPCPLDSSETGVVNGRIYRDDPATQTREGFTGFPHRDGGMTAGAGWDSGGGSPKCIGTSALGSLGGVSRFTGQPVLWGGGMTLSPGNYEASFLASAWHDGFEAPYLEFSWFERSSGRVNGAWTAYETDLVGTPETSFAGMSRFTVALNAVPQVPGQVWDVRVVSKAGGESHCTFLGPVYVTAQEGSFESPVFDSLSPRTVWQKVEWELDQNYETADPSCACPTPGNPITPVEIRFGVGGSASVAASSAVTPVHPDLGDFAVPAAASGRYFRFSGVLHGRDTAAAVDPKLAPSDPHRRFAGWRPAVRKLAVHYEARAGGAMSNRIAPASLRRWGKVYWSAETPGASAVTVDVLAPDGSVLFAGVRPGFQMRDSLDPYANPAVLLRARLDCDPNLPGVRPALLYWMVTWEPLPEKIMLDRDGISLKAGESLKGLVSVEAEGRVVVRAHDAGGHEVVVLLDEVRRPEATLFRWDGRGRDGLPVAPGVYSITATTLRGAGTRKVTVRP